MDAARARHVEQHVDVTIHARVSLAVERVAASAIPGGRELRRAELEPRQLVELVEAIEEVRNIAGHGSGSGSAHASDDVATASTDAHSIRLTVRV